MSCRVLIPTAGTGSRLGGLTRYINKSLVGIANRPVLSHIIEQFPQDSEFVIALGHKGHLVKELLRLAYPRRTFFFAEVQPFEGPESGLGLSILTCKQYLREPFIFISCDTLVREPIPNVDHNWMGYAELEDIEQYRTIELKGHTVGNICEKHIGMPATHKPYIGLSGIHDHELFWEAMENGGLESIRTGEAHGLRGLLPKGITAYRFTWLDTGNPEALARTREALKEPEEPNILEKPNEAIWFIDHQVIKFSDDAKFVANRVLRAGELKQFVPEVTGATTHMYRYTRVEGEILSRAITLPLFQDLLEYAKSFWAPWHLEGGEKRNFKKACMKFYKDKTYERVELFYKNFGKADGTEILNGNRSPALREILDALDWEWLADGIPGRFHGDFHFENILYSPENRRFVLLDWRQEFGGSLTTGDVYYDLAKLLHGLIICHELIAENHFWVDWRDDEIRFDFFRKQILVECERAFASWIADNGYDWKKVHTLTALVFLNIAALHHYPYSLLLYGLGKSMLCAPPRGGITASGKQS